MNPAPPSKSKPTPTPTPIFVPVKSRMALVWARGVYRDHLVLMEIEGGLWVASLDDGEIINWSGLACRCHRVVCEDEVDPHALAVLHGDSLSAALEVLTDIGLSAALVREDDSGRAVAFQFIEPASKDATANRDGPIDAAAGTDEVAAALKTMPPQLQDFAAECILSWMAQLKVSVPWNGRRGENSESLPGLPDWDIVIDLAKSIARMAPWYQRFVCRKVMDLCKAGLSAAQVDYPPNSGELFLPSRDWTPDVGELQS